MNLIINGVKIETDSVVNQLEDRLNSKTAELEKLIKKKIQLYDDMSEGIISKEDYRELSEHFTEKQKLLKQEIQSLERDFDLEQTTVELRKKKENAMKSMVRQMAETYLKCEELTVDMLQTFVDYIEVRDGEKRGEKALKIHWNF